MAASPSRPSSPMRRSPTRWTGASARATTFTSSCARRSRRAPPPVLLPWCPSCERHHARRGLLIMAGLRGRLCISDRAGRQPVFARTDQLVGWDAPPREQAGAEFVRRYRTTYGDPDVGHFKDWAGLGTRHARELWALAGDQPGRRATLKGVKLLGPGDPLLLGRDRE